MSEINNIQNGPSIDFTSDFEHENGNYQCLCTFCNNQFVGNKRRNSCRKCSAKASLENSDVDVVIVEDPNAFCQYKTIGFKKVAYYGPFVFDFSMKTIFPFFGLYGLENKVEFYDDLTTYLENPEFPTNIEELDQYGPITIFERFSIIPKANNYKLPSEEGRIVYRNHRGEVKSTPFHLVNGVTSYENSKIFNRSNLEDLVLERLINKFKHHPQDPMFEFTIVVFDSRATGIKDV